MKSANKYSVVWSGLKVTLVLIIYFHIMQFFGLAHNAGFRVLNGVFLLGGIYLYLSNTKKHEGEEFHYVENLLSGFLIGLINSVSFSAYITLYFGVIDPSFLLEVQQFSAYGKYINLMTTPLVIFVEGTASSFIFSFICMQYLKVNHVQFSSVPTEID